VIPGHIRTYRIVERLEALLLKSISTAPQTPLLGKILAELPGDTWIPQVGIGLRLQVLLEMAIFAKAFVRGCCRYYMVPRFDNLSDSARVVSRPADHLPDRTGRRLPLWRKMATIVS
jgi:hypothetical protein